MNLEKKEINDTGFLGSQGDIWDAQWDMFLALVGAMVAVPLLFRLHDWSMARLES
jgi:putative membrane protein